MTHRELMKLANGYAESKMLLTATELGVFTAIGRKWLRADEVARLCRSDREGMQLLLNALAGLGLVHLRTERYRNSATARKYLDAGSPTACTNLLWLLSHHWDNWTDMGTAIRNGRPGWALVTETESFRRRFAEAMHERSHVLAPLTVRTFQVPPGARRLLDIGGGSGSYAIALAQRHPRLRGLIVDQSVSVARRLIRQHRLGHRLHVRKGDVFKAPLGRQADAAIVANLLHDFSEQENLALLSRVREALRPGGKIFIVEFFLDKTRTSPPEAAVFSLLMYAFTAAGRSYAWGEVEGWLASLGFGRVRRRPIMGSIGTLEAVRL